MSKKTPHSHRFRRGPGSTVSGTSSGKSVAAAHEDRFSEATFSVWMVMSYSFPTSASCASSGNARPKRAIPVSKPGCAEAALHRELGSLVSRGGWRFPEITASRACAIKLFNCVVLTSVGGDFPHIQLFTS